MKQLEHKIYFISIHPTFIGEAIVIRNFKGCARSYLESLIIESTDMGIFKYTSYASLKELICKKNCVDDMYNLSNNKNYKLSSIGSCKDIFGISSHFKCLDYYVVPSVLTSTSLEYIYMMLEFVLDLKIDRNINVKYLPLYILVRLINVWDMVINPHPDQIIIDTAALFKAVRGNYVPMPNESLAQFQRRVLDYRVYGLKFNLDLAMRHFGIEVKEGEDRHTALADIRYTKLVYEQLRNLPQFAQFNLP